MARTPYSPIWGKWVNSPLIGTMLLGAKVVFATDLIGGARTALGVLSLKFTRKGEQGPGA